jgi:hypothetical protein
VVEDSAKKYWADSKRSTVSLIGNRMMCIAAVLSDHKISAPDPGSTLITNGESLDESDVESYADEDSVGARWESLHDVLFCGPESESYKRVKVNMTLISLGRQTSVGSV